mgnify:CR=1 FL=1
MGSSPPFRAFSSIHPSSMASSASRSDRAGFSIPTPSGFASPTCRTRGSCAWFARCGPGAHRRACEGAGRLRRPPQPLGGAADRRLRREPGRRRQRADAHHLPPEGLGGPAPHHPGHLGQGPEGGPEGRRADGVRRHPESRRVIPSVKTSRPRDSRRARHPECRRWSGLVYSVQCQFKPQPVTWEPRLARCPWWWQRG